MKKRIILTLLLMANISLFAQKNAIFTVGKEWIYNYSFTQNGFPTKFRFTENTNWEWAKTAKDTTERLVSTFGVRPKTVYSDGINAEYPYYQVNGNPFKEITRLSMIKESDTNLHVPFPNLGGFRLLGFSPDLYVSKPLFVGKKWEVFHKVNIYSIDDKHWRGRDTTLSKFSFVFPDNEPAGVAKPTRYEVVGETTIIMDFGEIPCYEIHAYCESKYGKAASYIFYNEKYGFLKAQYKNIDGSKANIELKEMKDLK